MKKPLILLIDDDRNVLDALEAELTPAFCDLCQIEAFEDPRTALDALSRWTAERRAIAVAVIDQKMSPMSGAEAIAAMRRGADAPSNTSADFRPADHMRAILLTGFAGLDAAIAAKNVAGVDRYLEKPWESESLRGMVSELLAAHLSVSGADEHIVFRRVGDPTELCEHFAIRHEAFAAAAVTAHLLPGTETRLDVDEYDRWSNCFNLYEAGLGTRRAIGTIRLVPYPAEPSPHDVVDVLAEYPALMARAGQPLAWPLPMLKYLIDRDAVMALLRDIQAQGQRAVEGGRLAVRPSARGAAGGQREAARHLVEGLHGYGWFVKDLAHSLVSCVEGHALLYARYGYRDTSGVERRVHDAFGEIVVCLHATPDSAPPPIRNRLQQFALRLRSRGDACRCPALADCARAYVAGDFTQIDVFCPARARERLAVAAP